MKTVDELQRRMSIADAAFNRCKWRLRDAVVKNPEYVSALAASDDAYAAWKKAVTAEREKRTREA